jgi:hypothetical protein
VSCVRIFLVPVSGFYFINLKPIHNFNKNYRNFGPGGVEHGTFTIKTNNTTTRLCTLYCNGFRLYLFKGTTLNDNCSSSSTFSRVIMTRFLTRDPATKPDGFWSILTSKTMNNHPEPFYKSFPMSFRFYFRLKR